MKKLVLLALLFCACASSWEGMVWREDVGIGAAQWRDIETGKMRKVMFNSDRIPRPDVVNCGIWTYRQDHSVRVDSVLEYLGNCWCKFFEQEVRRQ